MQRTPPSRRLAIVDRLRRVSSPQGNRSRQKYLVNAHHAKTGLTPRLRLTCLAAIRDGGGLGGRPPGRRTRRQRCMARLSSTIAHPELPPWTRRMGHRGAQSTLLSYQVAET